MNEALIYVIRVHDINYDEYDGFVCVAYNLNQALKLCYDESKQIAFLQTDDIVCLGEYKGKCLDPFIVLFSFNAG